MAMTNGVQYDRGQVLVDLAVAIADGAATISDLRVLANQPCRFGEVASVPTTWRTLEAVDEAALERIALRSPTDYEVCCPWVAQATDGSLRRKRDGEGTERRRAQMRQPRGASRK
jgi:hypothetical protein